MSSERRRIASATELRALSHPTRLALIDLLDAEGPLTATEAGERLGESPASASFHLRTLARYGFVEEAEGGRGRQRPWRITPQVLQVAPDEELGAEAGIAAGAFLELLRERDAERLRVWTATRHHYPDEWRTAAKELRLSVTLTPEELLGVVKTVQEALAPYVDREGTGERDSRALPISMGFHAVPVRPPADTDPDTDPEEER